MLDELVPLRSRPDSLPARPALSLHLTRSLALWCGGVAVLAGAALAAQPGQGGHDPTTPRSVWRQSIGVQEGEAGLRGLGPGYKVRFDPGRVSFTPALGAVAQRNLPLGFELESVRRGGELVYAVGSAVAPEREGGAVHYRHAGGITERYEVRAEGVEQSFAFATPLPGEGELVVRGRLYTDLPWPAGGSHAELDFRVPGMGGVHVGAVTGIDAAGNTASGSLRIDGLCLELSLPAEFVAAASYPFVLDPLIGAVFDVTSGAEKDILPDVAYDATNEVYLVIWEREFSVSDSDVRGQRVLPTGALEGGQIAIEDSDGLEARNPTVASVT